MFQFFSPSSASPSGSDPDSLSSATERNAEIGKSFPSESTPIAWITLSLEMRGLTKALIKY